MLSLPTAMLATIQIFFSMVYLVVEWIMCDFDVANAILRPNRVDLKTAPPSYTTVILYLLVAHFLGVLHNRRRRRDLRNHAKLLVEQDEKMKEIEEEVECCKSLLYNVFPAPVLERMTNRKTGEKKEIAEKFTECTFLFAKIVGLKEIIDLGERGERDPEDVITVLQIIFDQFDTLADTFKVQKVRKTVNEYYMVAAGLPDPNVIVGQKERALAITALAFSMVNRDHGLHSISAALNYEGGHFSI